MRDSVSAEDSTIDPATWQQMVEQGLAQLRPDWIVLRDCVVTPPQEAPVQVPFAVLHAEHGIALLHPSPGVAAAAARQLWRLLYASGFVSRHTALPPIIHRSLAGRDVRRLSAVLTLGFAGTPMAPSLAPDWIETVLAMLAETSPPGTVPDRSAPPLPGRRQGRFDEDPAPADWQAAELPGPMTRPTSRPVARPVSRPMPHPVPWRNRPRPAVPARRFGPGLLAGAALLVAAIGGVVLLGNWPTVTRQAAQAWSGAASAQPDPVQNRVSTDPRLAALLRNDPTMRAGQPGAASGQGTPGALPANDGVTDGAAAGAPPVVSPDAPPPNASPPAAAPVVRGESLPLPTRPAPAQSTRPAAAAAAFPPASEAASPQDVGLPPGVLALVSRGDAMLAIGDVSSARLLYARAAAQGSSAAALGMGRTFDPRFLARIGAGLAADPEAAASWYRRAAGQGNQEAANLLRSRSTPGRPMAASQR